MFREADVFVFTFGLTEAWIHRASGTVYPTAPGTIAGDFDPATFAFHNFDALEVLADFEAFRAALQAINPGVRFLVTVSPVPLTATATGEHVEVATCYSKAVLRAACGMLVARHPDIDYFPSFEIITSQNARGAYYEPNGRSVSSAGVETAMGFFLRAHGSPTRRSRPPPAPRAQASLGTQTRGPRQRRSRLRRGLARGLRAMIRIAIIGNSHAAAFKNGWATAEPRPSHVEIEFFAIAGRKFDMLEPGDDRVLRLAPGIARSSLPGALRRINGREDFDLKAFDCVLWIGRRHRLDQVAKRLCAHDIDGVREVEAATDLGRRLQLGRDALAATAMPEAHGAWNHRRCSTCRFTAPAEPGSPERRQRSALGAAGGQSHRRRGRNGCLPRKPRRSLRGSRHDPCCDSQNSTLAPGGLTLDRFALGSCRLRGDNHEEADVTHMNAAFGALCIDAFLNQIAPARTETALAEQTDRKHDHALGPRSDGRPRRARSFRTACTSTSGSASRRWSPTTSPTAST